MSHLVSGFRDILRAYQPVGQTLMRKLFKRTPTDAMSLIAQASAGLLFSSESDYPLDPFTWSGQTPFSPDALVKFAGLPPSTAVAKEDFDAFFAPMLKLHEGASPEAQTRAARFQKLVGLLRQYLSDLTVYKLGTVEITAFVVGQLADGRYAGLRTTVVET